MEVGVHFVNIKNFVRKIVLYVLRIALLNMKNQNIGVKKIFWNLGK